MFKIVFLLSLLLPMTTFAKGNHIGERAIFRLIIDGKRQGVAISDVLEKDESNNFTIQTHLIIEDFEDLLISNIPSRNIATIDSMNKIIENCNSLDGKMERIYMAGRLAKTCKLSIDNPIAKERIKYINIHEAPLSEGFVWLGAAPIYGIVKLNTPELILDLTYTRWIK